MAEGRRGLHGGILSLLSLIDEHQEAVEYDLIALGYRLRWVADDVHDFDWRDLLVVVKGAQHGSAIYRAVNGNEETEWTLANHLLAMIAENTSLNVWMKTRDASRNPPKNRPQPIFRPGVEDDSKKTIGGDTLEFTAMIEFLGDGYEVLSN